MSKIRKYIPRNQQTGLSQIEDFDGKVRTAVRSRRSGVAISDVLKRDRSTCQCCYMRLYKSEVHHIHRIDMGGEDHPNNMIVLCKACHRNVPVYADEFLEYQRKGGDVGAQFYDHALETVRSIYPGVTLEQFSSAYQEARFGFMRSAWNSYEIWCDRAFDKVPDSVLDALDEKFKTSNSMSAVEFQKMLEGTPAAFELPDPTQPIEAEIFALSCDRSTSQPSTPPQSRRKGKRSKSVAEGQLALF